MKVTPLVILILVSTVARAPAQSWDRMGNPPVPVTLKHPPTSPLRLGTVAFGQVQGECSDQIIGNLTEAFVEQNVTVIDRQNLEAALAEHKLNFSGYVDQSTAVQMGKMLGADALFIVRVSRCAATPPEYLHGQTTGFLGGGRPLYISKVKGSIVVSFQTVDLKTGRIFRARTINVSPVKENRSESGYPESPTSFEVIDDGVRQVTAEILHMFIPWTETRELLFFDDGDYNLKTAYNLFKVGQIEQALEVSKKNLQTCKADPKHKPKHLRHALHNVAMCLFAQDKFDEASPLFQEALTYEGGDVQTEAIAECQKAVQLRAGMEQFEEKFQMGAGTAAGAGETAPPPPPPAKAGLSAEDRLKKLGDLYKKGLISKTEYEAKKAEILKEM
ncbi:MAG: SHOCT domain-containing protein [Acidobacteria bacterium]|nr:SHOCT domain-containing protein [Acidobacteriota bacterium]